ncbi:hypothetical protein LEP1GSC195_2295 [Leptospira wolbachii serovar Codice str. CDC]|uniref:Uncharacterized protein n=1 Tax=Leptospira wolbachii serovar Codice str. CDC TaxID=1218599 RepID=R8ZZE1_9LEPT|nr:hypothetical protein [Leptospira wolbachii]EOQ95293.1 hypothetical protein LEP1GSC195_2295 [Leptospira wolbachii serovar Codice str. CDC]
MRKFPKTLNVSISLEHLPMTETDLKQICLDWEDLGFPFFRPAVVLDWETRTLPLGKSRLDLDLILSLRFWQSLSDWILPKWYSQKKRGQLTGILRNQLLSKDREYKPNSFSERWSRFWNTPLSLTWSHLGFTKLRMDLNLETDFFSNAHPLSFDGEKKFYFRTGYLKTIHYRLTKKEFKMPYPKFAEVYIKTRDKHKDESLGGVFYSFIGYLLEKKGDEYLLPYWGFSSTLPDSIRDLVPEEIWNFTNAPSPLLWKEKNLLGKELEFRTVYQVSTSSPNHPR